jgi:Glycosyltransferase family 92
MKAVVQPVEHPVVQALHHPVLLPFHKQKKVETNIESAEVLLNTPPIRSEAEMVELSKSALDAVPGMKTAACYKTLFGTVNLHRVISWIVYHHMLGFDHFFIWYLPYIREYDGFDVLSSLPYVTLTENTKASQERRNPQLVGELDQRALEEVCLKDVARDYDWVMFADTDEFLWFNETVGVKEFIQAHGDGKTSLSFGKYMYTQTHGVDVPDSGFGLDRFPFTSGSFCFNKIGCPKDENGECFGNPVCPRSFGRSKVIVQPKYHARVGVHGTLMPNEENHSVHFHTGRAHLKEWPALYRPYIIPMALTEKKDFVVTPTTTLSIHHAIEMAHKANSDGTYNMYYDGQLNSWFEYVVSRRAPSSAR